LRNKRRLTIPNSVAMSSDALIGFFSSTSYCGAYLRSIREPRVYLNSLNQEISIIAKDQEFPVDFSVELITAGF